MEQAVDMSMADHDVELECRRCDGAGELMICCDDVCVGAGECIHGDGNVVCPSCLGTGLAAVCGLEG